MPLPSGKRTAEGMRTMDDLICSIAEYSRCAATSLISRWRQIVKVWQHRQPGNTNSRHYTTRKKERSNVDATPPPAARRIIEQNDAVNYLYCFAAPVLSTMGLYYKTFLLLYAIGQIYFDIGMIFHQLGR